MKKLLSIAVTTLLLTFGLTGQPASAACSMTGTGASNDPWIIMTPADLAKIGVVEAGGCLTTYNQNQHYKLGANIALTGNFTPITIDVSSPYTGSFDGNNKAISGLNVSRAGLQNSGLFSSVGGATIKDFTLTGAAVSGSSYVGAIAGSVIDSLVQNIKVVMTGNIQGGQNTGGLIGYVLNSSITDLTYRSRGGQVTGSDYSGGGIGTVEASTLSNVAVESDVSMTGISGGVVGQVIPSSSTTINGIMYSGSFTGDQYVGGLIGYLWKAGGSVTTTITNSAVIGRVATASSSYHPKTFVGQIGSGITDVVANKNYSTASYFYGSTEETGSVLPGATVLQSANYYESWNGSGVIGGVNVAPSGITAAALAGGSTWTVAQKTSFSTSTGSEEWVVETGLNPANDGKPITKSAYNMGLFNPPCEAGSYSATGFKPCILAPAGTYVSETGRTSATDCAAGTFANNIGSFECTPAQAGYFVASSGSATQQACPAGLTSGVGATVCTSGAASSPTTAGPKFSGKPSIKGTVSVGKSLSVEHLPVVSALPITYSYAWYQCAKPVAAGETVRASAGCVEISSASSASLLLGSADAKKFVTAKVTAISSAGSSSYFAQSVNAKNLKYLGLAKSASLSGSAKVGNTVSVSKLNWVAASPSKIGYQWYRCSSAVASVETIGAGCKAISGAKSSSYRVGKGDKKKHLAVKISAVLGSSKLSATAGLAAKVQ